MAKLSPEALCKRSESAWSTKRQWQQLLNDAYRFALPMRNLYEDNAGEEQTPGQQKMTGVYDSTAIISTVKFANRIQADFMPPYRRWLDFLPGPFVPDAYRDQITRSLQVVQRKFFAVLHSSNYDVVANEALLELAAGTGCMLILEGDDEQVVDFTGVPVAQVAFTEGPKGKLDGWFRRFQIPVRLVKAHWKDATLTDSLSRILADEPEKKLDFEECTYYDYEDKIYRYSVVWKDTSQSKEQYETLVDRTYTTCPWVTPRWVKVPGEAQGRGPLLFALPDIRTANAVVALILKNASFAVSGMWVAADDGVINTATIRIVPGAVIKARNADNFRALEFGGRFDVAQIVLEDLRAAIRQALFDRSLPPETGQPRTATEIIERIKQLQQDIGAPWGRLMIEWVNPMVERVLDIMARKKMIEPVKVNGLTVQLKATSPLAQAQNLSDLEAAVQWMQILAMLSPQALPINVKVEDTGEWMAEKLGVDRAIVRPAAERAAMLKAGGQMIAAGAPGAENVIPLGGQGGAIPTAPNPAAVGMAA